MTAAFITRVSAALLALLPMLLASTTSQAGVIEAQLQQRVAAVAPTDEVAVIVQFRERENLALFTGAARAQRRKRLITALRATAVRTQGPLQIFAASLGGREFRQLWVNNSLALKLPAARIKSLAGHLSVESIRLDSLMSAPVTTAGAAAPPAWNLIAVKSPNLWAFGFTGTGVVIANMDTGVDAQHPDLAARYRGGTNSWFDPHGQHATPYDANGHGTQTMGVMVGGSTSGTAIGMAPDALWIAVKQYNDAGLATYSQIHQSFQWLLDPDTNENTDDAPHVVNASWGFTGTAGQCITEFNNDIEVLKTAGIGVVFAAGNDGPAPGTSVSPANNPQGFATGAVDATMTVADFSGRGPSACDGSIFPAVAAPGVNINTTDLSFGGNPFYMVVSGTSFAAPHTTGAMALLAGAFPDASVAQLEAALRDSAQDLGEGGADNSYGQGLVDVLAAYQSLGGAPNTPPQITSTPVTSATQDLLYQYDVDASDAEDDTLTYSLTQAPAGMTIDSASGVISWTPSASQVGKSAVAVRATDAHGQQDDQPFSIVVANDNDAPVAGDDSYQMVRRGSLSVAVPGVLGNDSDSDGDAITAQLVSAPANGVLSLNANGSFTYTPAKSFAGTTSFTYQAKDPAGVLSGVTSVSITVLGNRPPIAVNDRYTVPRRTSGPYTAPILSVLANDSDPDTVLDPANRISPSTLSIVTGPSKGGTASVITSGANAGRISYKPKIGFSGTETLTYKVKDTQKLNSNVASVSIRVRRGEIRSN